MENNLKTGRDYRAELARRFLLLYEVAAVVGIHPVRLGRMLREKERLTDGIRQKLDAFLREARLAVIDWEADEVLCAQNQNELERLNKLLELLIPDSENGDEVE